MIYPCHLSLVRVSGCICFEKFGVQLFLALRCARSPRGSYFLTLSRTSRIWAVATTTISKIWIMQVSMCIGRKVKRTTAFRSERILSGFRCVCPAAFTTAANAEEPRVEGAWGRGKGSSHPPSQEQACITQDKHVFGAGLAFFSRSPRGSYFLALSRTSRIWAVATRTMTATRIMRASFTRTSAYHPRQTCLRRRAGFFHPVAERHCYLSSSLASSIAARICAAATRTMTATRIMRASFARTGASPGDKHVFGAGLAFFTRSPKDTAIFRLRLPHQWQRGSARQRQGQ